MHRSRKASSTERDDGVEIVRLLGTDGDAVPADVSAADAAVNDDVALRSQVSEIDRLHRTTASRAPVAGHPIDVLRVEAGRTVIPIAAVGHRQHRAAAPLAREADILGFSGDGPRLRELKECSNSGAPGSVWVSPRVLGWAGRVTDSPPFLSSRRLLPVPASSGPVSSSNPNHGRVCGFVPATVRRASPPPTGRCQSGRTSVGVVPGSAIECSGGMRRFTSSSPVSSPYYPRARATRCSPPPKRWREVA